MTEKNYITPAGFNKLKAELEFLLKKERPEVTAVVAWAASNGDRSENADYKYGKQRLREIDRRIQFLSKRIDVSEIVDPISVQSDSVRFGATVTILDEESRQKIYRIVGVDEVNVDLGKISWKSPLGAALLKAKAGDYINYTSPKGEQSIEILKIEYLAIPD